MKLGVVWQGESDSFNIAGQHPYFWDDHLNVVFLHLLHYFAQGHIASCSSRHFSTSFYFRISLASFFT